MQEVFSQEIEDAVNKEKQTTADRMSYLETKYSQLVQQLSTLQPVLSAFVKSYLLLQKEVKQFPKVIRKTVMNVKKEVN